MNVFVAGAGLVLAVAGAVGLFADHRLTRNGQRVTGTVVDIQRKPGSDGPTSRPILGFRTLDGREMRVPARTSGRPQPGQQVSVIYDPRHPATAEIDTRAGRGIVLLIVVTLVGAGVLAYGVSALLMG